jgi:conjugative relaxase-like TrwC/TraI family protein
LDVLRLCSFPYLLNLIDSAHFVITMYTMWTMAKIREGAQWLSNHYATNDYYCEGEKVVGRWEGKGAEILGISGQEILPQDAAFLRIFSGQTPAGQKLTQRGSEIMGYDFQCGCQKSVSILALLGGDERLIAAHKQAVTEAFGALQSLACMQSRDENGSKRRITTGVLCAARFEHDTSRALDPQLHTHFALAKFTVDQAGERYALETHDMIKAIRYAGKVYQSLLRAKVEALGYKTRDKFSEKGELEGFEVKGISNELCEKYSQRRGEIEEQIEAFKGEYGREPTAAETHVIAKETRTSKLAEISTPEVRAKQRSRASAQELEQIACVKSQALENVRKVGPPRDDRSNLDPAELIALVRDHLAERRATFGEHDLIAEALNRGMGKVTLKQLVAVIRADPEIVRLDQAQNAMAVLTDQTNYEHEEKSVAFVNAGVDSRKEINANFVPFPALVQQDGKWPQIDPKTGVVHDYTEQRLGVEKMLRSRDQVFAMRGVAGAGKTSALKEFHAGVLAAGREHIMLAPTVKAREALMREIPGVQVETVEAFLLRAKSESFSVSNAVITVDEWGLLSNRAGHGLLAIAKQHGADVRFVGDTRQHVAVEAGDFARTLEEYSKLRFTTLSKISRQRDEQYREAISLMAKARVAEGLERLEKKGWIHEEKSGYLIEAAKRYLALTECGARLVAERGEPHVLAVAPTHAEIQAFTADVRAQMKTQGALRGNVIKRQAFVAYDSTRATRRSSKRYVRDLAVTLVSEKTRVKGLNAKEVYTVVETPRKDFVTLANQTGQRVTINVREHGAKLEFGAIKEIELQAGDRLWFRANSKGVTNGTLATLAGTDAAGRLVTTDGFVVPADYLKITYGYSTTSHTSQGLTAEYAIVFGSGFDQKSIYVAHSRARERVDTYVPSKEAFLSRAERDQGDRLGVLEAIAKNGKEQRHTLDPRNRPSGYRRSDHTPERNFVGGSAAEHERQTGKLALESTFILQCTPIEKGDFMAEQELIGASDKGDIPPKRREYLSVPYEDRIEAGHRGAKWDPEQKLWYIGPGGTRASLAKWLPENAARLEPVSDPREEFAAVLQELGADLSDQHPILDGRPHRVATLDDGRGEKTIFYVGHLDGWPAGYAKNNRTGEEQRWKASSATMTKEQFAAIAPQANQREADRLAVYTRTAARLAAQLETYTRAKPDHEYLRAKSVAGHQGLLENSRGSLAIPAYDVDGQLWSVQYVNQDGSKRFARESRKDGCFHVLGSGNTFPAGTKNIVIAEGYATAASLKQLHDEASHSESVRQTAFVAAFDAGNVVHAARSIRERYPEASIVIAADNDLKQLAKTGHNPGIDKGQEAALAVNGSLFVPRDKILQSEGGQILGSDWNDVAVSLGSDAEMKQRLIAAPLVLALNAAQTRLQTVQPERGESGNGADGRLAPDRPRKQTSDA